MQGENRVHGSTLQSMMNFVNSGHRQLLLRSAPVQGFKVDTQAPPSVLFPGSSGLRPYVLLDSWTFRFFRNSFTCFSISSSNCGDFLHLRNKPGAALRTSSMRCIGCPASGRPARRSLLPSKFPISIVCVMYVGVNPHYSGFSRATIIECMHISAISCSDPMLHWILIPLFFLR